jgi:hypothetical protein
MTANGKERQRKKPIVPEPSPRVLKWCAALAGVMLIALLVFDYTIGAKYFPTQDKAAQTVPHTKGS